MNAIPELDACVSEYLLFRGFTVALKAFEKERQSDRLQGFQVETIIAELHGFVAAFDAAGLTAFWAYLEEQFFSRLDSRFADTVAKLNTSLKRYYIINALQAGRPDVVTAFFEEYGEVLFAESDEWRSWFALPYLRNATHDPNFEVFFTPKWVETFSLSLSNFLTTIFNAIPLPRLLDHNAERLKHRAMEAQIRALRSEVKRLHHQLEQCAIDKDVLNRKLQTRADAPSRSAPIPIGSRGGAPDSGESPTVETGRPGGNYTSMAFDTLERAAGAVGDGSAGSSGPSGSGQDLGAAAARRRGLLNSDGSQASSRAGDDGGEGAAARSDGHGNDGGGGGGEDDDDEAEPFIVLSQEVFTEHEAAITACQFSRDGSMIASGSLDGTVRIWTFSTFPGNRNAVIECDSPVTCLSWDKRNDKLLLFGTQSQHIRMWNTATKKVVTELIVPEDTPMLRCLASSPLSSHFASGFGSVTKATDGGLALWSLSTQQLETWLDVDPNPTCVNDICFSAAGDLLLMGGSDGMVRIFDMDSQNAVMGWRAHDGAVRAVRFTEGDNRVLSLGDDGMMYQWDTRSFNTAECVYPVDMDPGLPAGMAANYSGDYILSTSAKCGSIFRKHRSNRVQVLGSHTGNVVAVDWHPDLNCCLTGSDDSSVRVSKLLNVVSR